MNLFNPCTILPDQYFVGSSRDTRTDTDGERRLMLAVLRDAVECYQRYALARDPRGRMAFAEAAEWIESNDDEWPFAYESICEILEMNPDYIRHGLSRWRQQEPPMTARSPCIVPLLERRRVEPDVTMPPASEETSGARYHMRRALPREVVAHAAPAVAGRRQR